MLILPTPALFDTNDNFGRICYCFRDIPLKMENRWILPPHPCLRTQLGGTS